MLAFKKVIVYVLLSHKTGRQVVCHHEESLRKELQSTKIQSKKGKAIKFQTEDFLGVDSNTTLKKDMAKSLDLEEEKFLIY